MSATLSSDRSHLQIAVRVNDLSAGVQPGRMWAFTFGSGQAQSSYFTAVAIEEADGNGFSVYGPGGDQGQPPLAEITGHLDPRQSLITMSVPLRLITAHRAEFDTFQAVSGRSVGTSGSAEQGTPAGSTVVGAPESTDVISDTAAGHATYVAGRGCLHS